MIIIRNWYLIKCTRGHTIIIRIYIFIKKRMNRTDEWSKKDNLHSIQLPTRTTTNHPHICVVVSLIRWKSFSFHPLLFVVNHWNLVNLWLAMVFSLQPDNRNFIEISLFLYVCSSFSFLIYCLDTLLLWKANGKEKKAERLIWEF